MGAIAPWREVLDQVDKKSQANTRTHTSWLSGYGCHRSHLMLQIPCVSCQVACTLKCWAKINPTFFCLESSLTDLWSQRKENEDKDFLLFFFLNLESQDRSSFPSSMTSLLLSQTLSLQCPDLFSSSLPSQEGRWEGDLLQLLLPTHQPPPQTLGSTWLPKRSKDISGSLHITSYPQPSPSYWGQKIILSSLLYCPEFYP